MERQRLAYELNKSDFYRAFSEHNFDEMSDIYNEITKYDDIEVKDGENTCFFTEILEGYKIKFPPVATGIIRSFGQAFYYALKDDCIVYISNECFDEIESEDIFFKDFKKENIEVAKVKITGDVITYTPKAVETLGLAVGDIVKIVICNESFYIEKYNPLLENKF